MKEYTAREKKIKIFEFSFEDYIIAHNENAKVKATMKIKQNDILFKENLTNDAPTGLTLVLIKKNSGPNTIENHRPLIVGNYGQEKKMTRLYMSAMQINRRHQLFGFVMLANSRIITHIETIRKTKTGCLVFRDVKNAYGSVDLDLMAQMINCPNLLEYFKRTYFGATVKLGKHEFQWKKGLFQGSSLSPLFFLIYMDYIINEIKNYADDVIVYMDDVVFYFKDSTENMKIIEKIFNSYCLFFNSVKEFEFTGDLEELCHKKYLNFPIFEYYGEYLKYIDKLNNFQDPKAYIEYLKNISGSDLYILDKIREKMCDQYDEIIAISYELFKKVIFMPRKQFREKFTRSIMRFNFEDQFEF